MNTRDMSKKQFDAACERWGFRRIGFLGYYEVGHGVSASILNRTTRREQLKFLIESKARARMDYEQRAAKAVKGT